MRLLSCLIYLTLACGFKLTNQVDVDISGFVYCVHNSSKVTTARVFVYNIGWFNYEAYVGVAYVSDDGFYAVNGTVSTWHEFRPRIEINHRCVRNWNISLPVTLNIKVDTSETNFILAPVILDAEKPTESEFIAFYEHHDYLRQNKDIIRSYNAPSPPLLTL